MEEEKTFQEIKEERDQHYDVVFRDDKWYLELKDPVTKQVIAKRVNIRGEWKDC